MQVVAGGVNEGLKWNKLTNEPDYEGWETENAMFIGWKQTRNK